MMLSCGAVGFLFKDNHTGRIVVPCDSREDAHQRRQRFERRYQKELSQCPNQKTSAS